MDDSRLFKDNFGKRVADLRISKGLTQQQLAAFLNIEFEQVIKLEKGAVDPTVSTTKKIADVLGVSMAEFCESF